MYIDFQWLCLYMSVYFFMFPKPIKINIILIMKNNNHKNVKLINEISCIVKKIYILTNLSI